MEWECSANPPKTFLLPSLLEKREFNNYSLIRSGISLFP
jgi:hypothetical protein